MLNFVFFVFAVTSFLVGISWLFSGFHGQTGSRVINYVSRYQKIFFIIHIVVAVIFALLIAIIPRGDTGTRYFVGFTEIPAIVVDNPVTSFFVLAVVFSALMPMAWWIVVFFLLIIFGNWTDWIVQPKPLSPAQKLGSAATILVIVSLLSSGVFMELNSSILADVAFFLFSISAIVLSVLSIVKGRKEGIVSGRAIVACLLELLFVPIRIGAIMNL